MNIPKFFALLGALSLAASSLFAQGEASCCATTSGSKASCEETFAKLDLSAKQKTQMQKLAADCDKAGCTKESFATMEKAAKRILNKKQFAAWKTSCGATSPENQS